jgi:hypothetical protein
MATIILLTAAQATSVRGPSTEAPNFAALAPIPLTDGRCILGVEVLSDPLHAEDATLLSTLPQADSSTIASLMPPGKAP